MSKLVSANFSRVFRNKFFWICLVVVLGFGTFIAVNFMLNNPWCREQISYETLYTCVRNVPWLSFVLALFISLWVGVEYSGKTIRNKIAAGHSKWKIYFANWLVCIVVSALLYLVLFLTVALPIAPWGNVVKYNGNIVPAFLKRATIDLFAVVALASVFVFITMLMKNRMLGVVVTMMTAILLMFVAEVMVFALTEPEYLKVMDTLSGEAVRKLNPDYVGGVKRGLLQFVTNIQPIGQMLQVNLTTVGGVKGCLLPVYSCLVSIVSLFGGAYLFGKKDLE